MGTPKWVVIDCVCVYSIEMFNAQLLIFSRFKVVSIVSGGESSWRITLRSIETTVRPLLSTVLISCSWVAFLTGYDIQEELIKISKLYLLLTFLISKTNRSQSLVKFEILTSNDVQLISSSHCSSFVSVLLLLGLKSSRVMIFSLSTDPRSGLLHISK